MLDEAFNGASEAWPQTAAIRLGSPVQPRRDAVRRVDLGTAVRVRVAAPGRLTRWLEGVVIKVVDVPDSSSPAPSVRFLVQFDGWQVEVRARDLQVVAW